MTIAPDKEALRILRFLAAKGVRREPDEQPGRMRLVSDRRGTISVGCRAFRVLERAGLIEEKDRDVWLTEVGIAASTRLKADAANFTAQHAELSSVVIDLPEGPHVALANQSESPLGQLARRKGRDGKPFLRNEEFAAGERLRADYTQGLLLPRLGANWSAAGAGGKAPRSPGGGVELTDRAIAARRRVDAALSAVGPELAGLLVDVCCFLKGLETVEIERGWPVRSAKVVLKAALSALDRHYMPGRQKRQGDRILHWGGEGYRPRIARG